MANSDAFKMCGLIAFSLVLTVSIAFLVNDVTAQNNASDPNSPVTGTSIQPAPEASNPAATVAPANGNKTTTEDPCQASSITEFQTILVLVMAIAAALLSKRNSA